MMTTFNTLIPFLNWGSYCDGIGLVYTINQLMVVISKSQAPSPYIYAVYTFYSAMDRDSIRYVTKGVSGIYC